MNIIKSLLKIFTFIFVINLHAISAKFDANRVGKIFLFLNNPIFGSKKL